MPPRLAFDLSWENLQKRRIQVFFFEVQFHYFQEMSLGNSIPLWSFTLEWHWVKYILVLHTLSTRKGHKSEMWVAKKNCIYPKFLSCLLSLLMVFSHYFKGSSSPSTSTKHMCAKFYSRFARILAHSLSQFMYVVAKIVHRILN